MSLTKKTLLDAFKQDPPHLLGEFFGVEVYVKPITEFARSRRMSQMFDHKKGEPRKDALERSRGLTIVDHVCDADGNLLFSEKEVTDIMASDASKLDTLIVAIEEWMEDRVGKHQAKSKNSKKS